MTNTNDFRKYSYQSDTAYLLQGFNVSRSSAVPKEKPVEKPKEGLRVLENEKRRVFKSTREIKAEAKAVGLRAFICIVVAISVVAMFGVTLRSYAMKNELTREISSLQTQISNAQSENISLQSQLDAMVSIGTIEDYAVNKLHMSKMNSSMVQYVDVDQYKQERMAMIAKANASTNQKSNK